MRIHLDKIRFPILLLAVCGVLLPVSPRFIPIPNRDQGVFLYAGQQILTGDLLYRDIWDHKPPLIHHINALGILLGRGSSWGVWLLELASMLVAAALGFVLIDRTMGLVPALLGSTMCVLQAGVLLLFEGGNYPEEFALPVQFAALYLSWRALEAGSGRGRWYTIGTLAAIAFLLKQNLIGIWLAIGVYLLVRAVSRGSYRASLIALAQMLAGAASIVVIVLVYFSSTGALEHLWSATFEYNFAYAETTTGFESRRDVVFSGLLLMGLSGVAFVALPSWPVALLRLRRAEHGSENLNFLLAIALIDLPLEVALVTISGRS